MHEWMCRSPGGLGGGWGGREEEGSGGLGRAQDGAPVSGWAGAAAQGWSTTGRGGAREDPPTLRGGEEGPRGSAQGGAGQENDLSLPVLSVYLCASCLAPWKRDLLECSSAVDSSCSFFFLTCPSVLKILTSFGLLCCGEKVCPILPKC